MNNKYIKIFSLILIPLFLSACVTSYKDFPEKMIDNPPEPVNQGVLNYKIERFPIINSGGEAALRKVFQNKTPFVKTKEVDDISNKGIYCYVDVEYKPLTFPALIFGYISLSTFTILPAWSTKDGYRVKYHLYVDGEEQEVYTYEITRKAGTWIVLLPLVWINLMTYSEEDAFEATAYQFFSDASLIIK